MKSIDFETHFYTKTTAEYLKRRTTAPMFKKVDNQPNAYTLEFTDNVYLLHTEEFMNKLLDIGEGRIARM
jgi:hypothetical protein